MGNHGTIPEALRHIPGGGRVVWAEYPFPPGGGMELAKPRLLLWEGRTDPEPMWSDAPNQPSVPERYLRARDWLREGTILAFFVDLVLVADTRGCLRTIEPKYLRLLPTSVVLGA